MDSNFKQQNAYVRVLAARRARGLHRLHPPRTEGAGKAGCRLHPRSCAQKTHEWTTGSTGSLRLSPHEWVTAYFALSPVTGLFATVASRIDDTCRTGWPDASPQALTPAPGRQDHTTSPSATVSAKGLAGPRTIRPVSSKMGCSVVRPRAVRSLTGDPPCNPLRARRCRVHRIPPRVRDVRETPLFGWDGASL
jgi:hypothetical protein